MKTKFYIINGKNSNKKGRIVIELQKQCVKIGMKSLVITDILTYTRSNRYKGIEEILLSKGLNLGLRRLSRISRSNLELPDVNYYAFKIACWALIFIFRLCFPPGVSIAIFCWIRSGGAKNISRV